MRCAAWEAMWGDLPVMQRKGIELRIPCGQGDMRLAEQESYKKTGDAQT